MSARLPLSFVSGGQLKLAAVSCCLLLFGCLPRLPLLAQELPVANDGNGGTLNLASNLYFQPPCWAGTGKQWSAPLPFSAARQKAKEALWVGYRRLSGLGLASYFWCECYSSLASTPSGPPNSSRTLGEHFELLERRLLWWCPNREGQMVSRCLVHVDRSLRRADEPTRQNQPRLYFRRRDGGA